MQTLKPARNFWESQFKDSKHRLLYPSSTNLSPDSNSGYTDLTKQSVVIENKPLVILINPLFLVF